MFRLNSRSNFSHADVLIFGLGYAALVFTFTYYATGFQDAFKAGFAVEDGPVEWVTAIALLIAALVLGRNTYALWRRGNGLLSITMTFLYALYSESRKTRDLMG